MPPQVQRRNARLNLWPAGGWEKGIDGPGRPHGAAGGSGQRPLPSQPCTLSMTVFDLWLLSEHKPATLPGPYPFGRLDLSEEAAGE